eukprot:6188671-Pleurochrysis_carterae.AAC.1
MGPSPRHSPSDKWDNTSQYCRMNARFANHWAAAALAAFLPGLRELLQDFEHAPRCRAAALFLEVLAQNSREGFHSLVAVSFGDRNSGGVEVAKAVRPRRLCPPPPPGGDVEWVMGRGDAGRCG